MQQVSAAAPRGHQVAMAACVAALVMSPILRAQKPAPAPGAPAASASATTMDHLRADAPVRLREVLAGRPPAPSPIWRANATQILQARDLAIVAGTATEKWLADRARDLDIVAKIAPVRSNLAGVEAVLDRKADVFFA